MPAELDPGSAHTMFVGTIKLVSVPKVIRDFGYHPNISLLQAGDLLLVAPVRASLISTAVERAQLGVHAPLHAKWIHAAMYIGRNLIIELDGAGGVKIAPLWKYTCTHKMKFRRAQQNHGVAAAPPSPDDIDELTGYKIAVAGLQNFNTKYSLVDAARSGWTNMVRRRAPNGRVELRTAGAVCSTMYSDAVYQVLHRQAAPPIPQAQHFQPADLSASDFLRDLDDVTWAKIVY